MSNQTWTEERYRKEGLERLQVRIRSEIKRLAIEQAQAEGYSVGAWLEILITQAEENRD